MVGRCIIISLIIKTGRTWCQSQVAKSLHSFNKYIYHARIYFAKGNLSLSLSNIVYLKKKVDELTCKEDTGGLVHVYASCLFMIRLIIDHHHQLGVSCFTINSAGGRSQLTLVIHSFILSFFKEKVQIFHGT